MNESDYVVGRHELSCYKPAEEYYLHHDGKFCLISLHTLDRDKKDLETWAVSVNGPGNVLFQYINCNEDVAAKNLQSCLVVM